MPSIQGKGLRTFTAEAAYEGVFASRQDTTHDDTEEDGPLETKDEQDEKSHTESDTQKEQDKQ